MNRQEMNERYDYLCKIHERFLNYERDFKHGSNKKTREKALKKAKMEILLFQRAVEKEYTLLKIATGEDSDEQKAAIIWQEFVSLNWFGRDAEFFLQKLKDIISNSSE